MPKKQRRNDLRLVAWEFFCKVCAIEFEADWTPALPIRCPRCGTSFDTSWQFTAGGDLVGPWLSNRVAGNKGAAMKEEER